MLSPLRLEIGNNVASEHILFYFLFFCLTVMGFASVCTYLHLHRISKDFSSIFCFILSVHYIRESARRKPPVAATWVCRPFPPLKRVSAALTLHYPILLQGETLESLALD